jgi:hypothetical protein
MVYDRFRVSGAWPPAQGIRLAIRRDGELRDLCHNLGGLLIFCGSPDQSTATCDLRVHALPFLQGAKDDIKGLMASIRYFVKRYIEEVESKGEVRVSGPELEAALGMTEAQARRVVLWLQYAPLVLSQSTPDLPQSRAQLTVSHDVLQLEGITTLDEYLVRSDALEQERQRKAIAQSAVVRQLVRPQTPRGPRNTEPTPPAFIDDARLIELRGIRDERFDLRRLIAICEELNVCYQRECFLAVAMLTRALLDHVPPVFNSATFEQVASNYRASKSFKDQMTHLEKSARKIADAHLHVQIRASETLPTRTQVNFSAAVDVLLAEIVRILSK